MRLQHTLLLLGLCASLAASTDVALEKAYLDFYAGFFGKGDTKLEFTCGTDNQKDLENYSALQAALKEFVEKPQALLKNQSTHDFADALDRVTRTARACGKLWHESKKDAADVLVHLRRAINYMQRVVDDNKEEYVKNMVSVSKLIGTNKERFDQVLNAGDNRKIGEILLEIVTPLDEFVKNNSPKKPQKDALKNAPNQQKRRRPGGKPNGPPPKAGAQGKRRAQAKDL